MYFYGIDPLYFIMIAPVFVFSLWAQFRVKSNFRKYARYKVRSGLSGKEVARLLLEKNGIRDVRIESARGMLSDHYSPVQRRLALSSGVYNSTSVSALGVAAHEVGHAIQHHRGMVIMRVWQALAVPATFMSNTAIFLIFIGFFVSLFLAKLGFFLFLGVVLFQILTLPLEFDASRRAKDLLLKYGVITAGERRGVSAVLNSAALTYVAAAAASITQLLYFALILFGGRRS
ncbi:MAG: zinc metallopeptidase [Spirochaetia bacterium]